MLNISQLYARLKLANKKRRIQNAAKKHKLDQYDNVEDLFTDYYKNRTWSGGGEETVSGSGSTLKITRELRSQLPAFLEKHGIRSIFDAPCGDFNWFNSIELGSVQYTGGDIVREMVEKNQETFARVGVQFIHFDILKDSPPVVDAWFCRDVLLHFSYQLIWEFLENFVNSGIRYLLVSNYHEFTENIDIPTGAGRPVNLEKSPFNLPSPIDWIEDDIKGRRPKRMALWSRETIQAALDSRPDRT